MNLQKRLQCLAASGCWVSALLSWESVRLMQEGRRDCCKHWVMLPDNAMEIAIYDIGGAGEKIPAHCSF